jgi:hypothetical protein
MEPVIESSQCLADLFPAAERVYTAAPAGRAVAAYFGLMGKVNAYEFDGRAPGTLLFLGPEVEPGQPIRLAFACRAEGWQVPPEGEATTPVQFLTGEPLYRAADFTALRG